MVAKGRKSFVGLIEAFTKESSLLARKRLEHVKAMFSRKLMDHTKVAAAVIAAKVDMAAVASVVAGKVVMGITHIAATDLPNCNSSRPHSSTKEPT